MGVDNSRMGLTFAHPRVTRAKQEEALLEAGASRIVHVGKDCPTWKEAVRQVRDDDVMFIYAGVMVPASRQKCNMKATAQWASFMTELHKRGGTVVEVLTGRKSAILKQQRELNKETDKLLKFGGKRLPASGKPPGRKLKNWPDKETEKDWRRKWKSKNYASDAAVIREAKEAGFTERMMRRFGKSGRNG